MPRIKQEEKEVKPAETKAKEPVAEVKKSKPVKGVDKKTNKAYTRERKRKPGFASRGKFDIPEELIPDGWTLYWVKDGKSRIAELENNDWVVYRDAAMNKELFDKEGDVITQFGSIDLIEKEQNHILMAKSTEWVEADRKEKQKINDDVESSIRRGSGVEGGYLPKGQKDAISK